MIHLRQHDFITRLPIPRQHPRKLIGKARHVEPDDDFLMACRTQHVSHRLMRRMMDGACLPSGGEIATEIGIGVQDRIPDRIANHHRHLCARRIVEIDAALAVIVQGKGWK